VARLEQERGVLQVRNIRTDFDLAHAKATRAILGNKVVDLETQVRGHLFLPALVLASHFHSSINPLSDNLYTCSCRVDKVGQIQKLQILSLIISRSRSRLTLLSLLQEPFIRYSVHLSLLGWSNTEVALLLITSRSSSCLILWSLLQEASIQYTRVPAWLVKVGSCRRVS
jgi:hypothetical protein